MELLQYENVPIVGIQLKQCGWEQCQSLHSYGPTFRDFYLIHFIISGRGWFRREDKTYHLSAGQGFVIFPGETTIYCADQKEPWEYYWVGFVGEDALSMLHDHQIQPESPVFQCDDVLKMRDYIVQIYESVAQGSPVAATGWLYVLLSSLKGKNFTELSFGQEMTLAKSYFDKAMWYIQGFHTQHITVSDVANYIGISRSYLFRVFQEISYMSPQEMINAARIATACRMLQETQESIEQIAYQSGFGSASRFCFCFKRAQGVSPTAFRKACREQYYID